MHEGVTPAVTIETSTQTGGQLLIAALKAHGVSTVFGIPGAHTLAIYDALHDEPDIRNIVVRHEGGAGYMADGYARASGKPGVVLTITGPGATNAITAVGGAYADSSPLLVISSQIPTAHLDAHNGFLHEMIDQRGAFAAVTDWTYRVMHSDEIQLAIDAAFAHFSQGRPTPAYIEIPMDLLDEAPTPIPAHVGSHTRLEDATDLRPPGDGIGNPGSPLTVSAGTAAGASDHGQERAVLEEALIRAAELLLASQRPVIYAGWGVISANATAALIELAELLQAPVATSIKGKGAIADDHPLCIGCAWAAEVRASPALTEADLMLAIGTRFTLRTAGWGRAPIPCLLIHADIDPSAIGRTVPAQLALHGDALQVLQRLIALVRERLPQSSAQKQRDPLVWGGYRAAVRQHIDRVIAERSPFVSAVLAGLRQGLARDAIICNDNCLLCFWAGRYLPVYEPRTWLFPMQFCTLGWGLPAAIGAKIAHPDRQVVALAGDGGFMFSCQELISASALGLNLPVVVFNDAAYGSVRENQTKRYGGRHTSIALATPDFPKLAEACHCHGVLLEHPSQLPQALAQAFAADRPTLIELRAQLEFP